MNLIPELKSSIKVMIERINEYIMIIAIVNTKIPKMICSNHS